MKATIQLGVIIPEKKFKAIAFCDEHQEQTSHSILYKESSRYDITDIIVYFEICCLDCDKKINREHKIGLFVSDWNTLVITRKQNGQPI